MNDRPCKYEQECIDWVPYGSTQARMVTPDCQYEGDIDIGDSECGPDCPAYQPALTREDYELEKAGL